MPKYSPQIQSVYVTLEWQTKFYSYTEQQNKLLLYIFLTFIFLEMSQEDSRFWNQWQYIFPEFNLIWNLKINHLIMIAIINSHINYMRCYVLMDVRVQMMIFWDVTSRSLATHYQHFGATYCINFQIRNQLSSLLSFSDY